MVAITLRKGRLVTVVANGLSFDHLIDAVSERKLDDWIGVVRSSEAY